MWLTLSPARSEVWGLKGSSVCPFWGKSQADSQTYILKRLPYTPSTVGKLMMTLQPTDHSNDFQTKKSYQNKSWGSVSANLISKRDYSESSGRRLTVNPWTLRFTTLQSIPPSSLPLPSYLTKLSLSCSLPHHPPIPLTVRTRTYNKTNKLLIHNT